MLTKRERWLMVQAFRAGYGRGHTDTAEGCYNGVCERENDCAFEWIDDMAAQEIERGGKAEMSDVRRYEWRLYGDNLVEMELDEHGTYVRHEDYERLERENAELRKALVSGFYEDDVPDEVQGYVNTIAELRKKLEQAHGVLRAILDHHERQRALFYETGDMDAADYHEERRNFARCFLPEPPK